MRIIKCDSCGKHYKVKENNKKGTESIYRCKSCSQLIIVPNKAAVQHSPPLAQVKTSRLEDESFDHEIGSQKLPLSYNKNPELRGNPALSLRTKFNLIILLIVSCAVVLIYFLSSIRLQRDAENQVFEKARLLLTTMEASRNFTSKVVKPALYQALPDRFITEGMSSSFGARNIFERIRKNYPQYYFKHAATFPRNPINQADEFELGIINKFSNNAELGQWQGYRVMDDEKVYSIMKPIVAEQRCMRCHSEPELAPTELLERYGKKNGFGRSVGEVIGTLTVSVPATVAIEKAKTNTIVFIGMVILFLSLLTLLLNIFFSKFILSPIRYLSHNADEISLGRLDTHINTSGGDEIAKLAKAFERMKISIKMAFEQFAK